MKRLSFAALAFAALAFTGFGFPRVNNKAPRAAVSSVITSTVTSAAGTVSPASSSVTPPAGFSLAPTQAKFYWFDYPDDYLIDYNSISDECYELWIYYGVLVNTSSGGGMLVARGYPTGYYPHNFLPTQFLYAHY